MSCYSSWCRLHHSLRYVHQSGSRNTRGKSMKIRFTSSKANTRPIHRTSSFPFSRLDVAFWRFDTKACCAFLCTLVYLREANMASPSEKTTEVGNKTVAKFFRLSSSRQKQRYKHQTTCVYFSLVQKKSFVTAFENCISTSLKQERHFGFIYKCMLCHFTLLQENYKNKLHSKC